MESSSVSDKILICNLQFYQFFFQNLEENSDSDSEADNLEWLPDPNKIYGSDQNQQDQEQVDEEDE